MSNWAAGIVAVLEAGRVRTPGLAGEVGNKTCAACGCVCSMDYFPRDKQTRKRSPFCLVCVGEQKKAQPWTAEEVARLVAAATAALDLWAYHTEHLTENDRVSLRELVCAVDRIPDLGAD